MMLKGKVSVFAAAALGLLLIGSQVNAAFVTFDTRATAVAGGAVLNNTKNVTVSAAGQTVTLQVWAIVTNANGNSSDDGFQLTHGGVMSSPGAGAQPTGSNLLGDISTMSTSNAFSVVSSGTSQDLDADTDKDLGGTSGASSAGFATVSNTSMLLNGSAGNSGGTAAANEYYIGSVTFTVGAGVGPNMSTLANWFLRQSASTSYNSTTHTTSAAANQTNQFESDGITYKIAGDQQFTPGFMVFNPGVNIHTATVPEPASFVLAGLGGLGLLVVRRHRRK